MWTAGHHSDAANRVINGSPTPCVLTLNIEHSRQNQFVGSLGGKTFTILNKTSSGVVSGPFAGKANGSIFRTNGYSWRISYTGGDGNDVTLTVQ